MLKLQFPFPYIVQLLADFKVKRSKTSAVGASVAFPPPQILVRSIAIVKQLCNVALPRVLSATSAPLSALSISLG